MAKSKETIEDRQLCEGVMLGKSFFEKKENRILTLFLKGFVVYLLSMGSIGFYLSAFNIEYNTVICHGVIFIMAILCACLYYRLLVENLGYLILLVAFGGLVMLFRTYINSGFYAIVNITTDKASQYFDVDIQRLYNEQIGNRYLTVSCVVIFIGIVLDIFLNVYISRRMQYVTVSFFIMGLNMIPLYLVAEPDMIYSVMLIAGMAMAYIFKSGRHYSPQVSVRRYSYVFEEKGRRHKTLSGKVKEKEIAYVYDVKAMIQAGIIGFCFVFVAIVVASAFKPKENFNAGYEGNKYKQVTMAAVSSFLIDGWSAFYRRNQDTGGMSHGRLGDVSTVYLDYETDLVVQVAPYSFDTIYLKSFTGIRYNPYDNSWTSMDIMNGYDVEQTPEADALSMAYMNGEQNTSKAKMRINNVGADARENYLPYYYYDEPISSAQGFVDVIFYPRLDGNEAWVYETDYTDCMPYTDADLYVPEENYEAVEYVVSQFDWIGTNEEVVRELVAYFQAEIPYTIRPGKTPKNEDFVNYFILENQKGYCAHYATAAVLVLRYMGIPARYVEGYAIDYNQITDGELVEGARYSDYYDGYSELGETALVEVNVTDADAHAWIEIYDFENGWIPVEVTPVGEVEEAEDFWTMFENIMGSGDTSGEEVEITQGEGFKISDELVRNICYVLLGLLGSITLVFGSVKGIKFARYFIRFNKADNSDKLIMKYASFCKKIRKRDKDFRDKINYKEQVEYLYAKKYDANKTEEENVEVTSDKVKEDTAYIICVLEKAGFSGKVISQEEYNIAIEWLKNAGA
ncbi:MAG: transglutaminase domain-containing protein [Lachnospiraceae bacterium]|nr:transglutaminase domain-containing protein [Lachnospiraceae bacterium]